MPADGYFVLQWQSEVKHSLKLQQSRSSNFTDPEIYIVPASGALTVTGLEDGSYYFRLQGNESSGKDFVPPDLLEVTVTHHSLQRAVMFFSLGMLLLVILLGTLVIGNRQRGSAE